MSLQKFFGKKCLRWFNKIIQEATVIPYDEVLHLPDEYLQNNTRLRIIKKYLHKYLRLKLHGQQKLEVRKLPIYKVNSGINNSVNNNINDTHGTLNSNINNTINSSINNNISSNINNRILWIFTGKRNVGDAMMDISGRALLKGKGCQIDLLTLPELWKLFKDDDVFTNVYSTIEAAKINTYDFILMSEFNHPSITLKTKYFKKVPYACLFRFFYGPARNQTCFSYSAINDVFNLGLSKTTLLCLAKPYLYASEASTHKIKKLVSALSQKTFITICIGGIDANRSYQYWPELLSLIDQSQNSALPKNIILLGSENGLVMSKKIMSEKILQQHAKDIAHIHTHTTSLFPNLNITSYVGKLSLLECHALIARSKFFIGCDGGLMHVAHTTPVTTVTLFANQEPPELWLTPSIPSHALYRRGDVNNIAPSDIIKKLDDVLEKKIGNSNS